MMGSLIRVQGLRRCVAYLSIEQLGAIEGETPRREKGRLSHLTILGKIRTPRKEGERGGGERVSRVSSGNLSPIGSRD